MHAYRVAYQISDIRVELPILQPVKKASTYRTNQWVIRLIWQVFLSKPYSFQIQTEKREIENKGANYLFNVNTFKLVMHLYWKIADYLNFWCVVSSIFPLFCVTLFLNMYQWIEVYMQLTFHYLASFICLYHLYCTLVVLELEYSQGGLTESFHMYRTENRLCI